MLRSRQSLAVIFSIVLVVGAMWVRYANAKDAKNLEAALIADDSRRQEQVTNYSNELLNSASDTPTQNSAPLTQTDLVSRQLFSDYMSLSTKGQATPENLNNLAAKYVQNIQNTDTASQVTLVDIKTVEDSDLNLKSYGQAIFGIRSKYQNLIKQKTSSMGTLTPGTTEFSSFMKDVAALYTSSAAEVKALPVPISLASNHLKLINNYLSSANAATNLIDVSKDPIVTYAAINIQVKNGQEESDLFKEIQTALTSKGLFFETNL